jgi:hypothetical protein
MTGNSGMRLTARQAATLQAQAAVQAVIFGFCVLPFAGLGVAGLAAFFHGAIYPDGTPGFLTAATLLILGLFLAVGLIFAWLAISTLWFAFRMPDVRVLWYEGTPVKATFYFRQQANIGAGSSMLTSPRLSSAWLRHDGKKFAVDLDLFRRIPDQGTFRFRYILRPGFPGVLTPYLIIGFEPAASPARDSPCRCMAPPFSAEDYRIAPIGTDQADGRFGDVSIATCKVCGKQWLHYQVEYEAFEKSGRWYRGVIAPEMEQAIRPETALAVLGQMEWYFAGGSYFESSGFKSSGAPAVGP